MIAPTPTVTDADHAAIASAIGRQPDTPPIETTADLIAAYEITRVMLSLALRRLHDAIVEIQRLRAARDATATPRRAA
jgi:hypothetical protein